jgi:hypothetical protein
MKIKCKEKKKDRRKDKEIEKTNRKDKGHIKDKKRKYKI